MAPDQLSGDPVRLFRAILVSLVLACGLAIPSGFVSSIAAAAPSCGTLDARVQSLNAEAQGYRQRVGIHNAKVAQLNAQRDSVDRRNSAAVAAWNASRQQLLNEEYALQTEGAQGQRQAYALREEARQCGAEDSTEPPTFTPPSGLNPAPDQSREHRQPAPPRRKAPSPPSQRNYPEPPANWKSNWSNGKLGDSRANALTHYENHGHEFRGITSPEQYAAAANGFLKNPPPGTFRLTRPNGDVLLYNSGTNTFLSATHSGQIKTMFKPDDHLDYWLGQLKAAPGALPGIISRNIADVLG
ncbi:hypothetical protein [Gordonia sp. SL306]|uniref:hypothetical protein n=1 Tax=Gordonia sp. SL306 TaxID=2995145 RepID=UPI00226E64C9|nr:hypothetical protein [Gordonia sp. SL306]WAC56943.1 hypothetical protein OVA31_06780 [Gordonia sp. SL306]